jgi:3-dehydroquinate synthase
MTQAHSRSTDLASLAHADASALRPSPPARAATTSVTLTLAQPTHTYDVRIGSGVLAELGPLMRQVAPHDRTAIIADVAVAPHHGPTITQSVQAAGYNGVFHTRDFGEPNKNLRTVRDLYEVFIKQRLERNSPVVAFGGGVVGDSVGFAASTYLRGVPFVQCPTTLLAMVDASVGGKVGVNLSHGKNLIGSFCQPVLVLIDVDTLETLPRRELRGGMAECVKHAVIRDPALFDWIDAQLDAIMNLDPPTMAELVHRNVQIKANVVMADEREKGERAHLNFGHTFAHAIEATCGFERFSHGEAVSLGMVAASRLAATLGLCPADLPDRLVDLLSRIGLPTYAHELAQNGHLLDVMRLDKKVAAGKIRLVLPTGMGSVILYNDATEEQIAATWNTLRRG